MTVVKMTANVQCTYVNVLYIHTVQQNVFFFPLMILLSLTFLSSTQNFKWCKCQNSFQSAYFFIIKSDNFANSLSEHCEFHTYKWTIQYTVSEERENEREREEREYEREDARMNEISDGKPESTSEEVLSRSSLFSH